jgi:hypothetical protein
VAVLREGVLTHISTDHAPSTLEQKREGDMWDVHFRHPGLDSTLALLLDAPARTHRLRGRGPRLQPEPHEDVRALAPQRPGSPPDRTRTSCSSTLR